MNNLLEKISVFSCMENKEMNSIIFNGFSNYIINIKSKNINYNFQSNKFKI